MTEDTAAAIPTTEDGSLIMRPNMIQMSPDPAHTVWDAAVHFPDGFTVMIDRLPHPDPSGIVCVPPERLKIEGWIGPQKMFAASINLTGGARVVQR